MIRVRYAVRVLVRASLLHSQAGLGPLLVIGLPIALGAGGGLLWGVKGFFRTVGERSARGFNFVWIAVAIAILVPVVFPFFFVRKSAKV